MGRVDQGGASSPAQHAAFIDATQRRQFLRGWFRNKPDIGRDFEIPAGTGKDFLDAGKSEIGIKLKFARTRMRPQDAQRGNDGGRAATDESNVVPGISAVQVTWGRYIAYLVDEALGLVANHDQETLRPAGDVVGTAGTG